MEIRTGYEPTLTFFHGMFLCHLSHLFSLHTLFSHPILTLPSHTSHSPLTPSFTHLRCDRPVRLMLDRHEDMVSTGTRHPFLARYKVHTHVHTHYKVHSSFYPSPPRPPPPTHQVGCTKEGILKAELELFSNSGFTLDLSVGVLHRAMWHVDNAYFIPHWRVVGRNCRTNVPSNTAFRGFGGR